MYDYNTLHKINVTHIPHSHDIVYVKNIRETGYLHVENNIINEYTCIQFVSNVWTSLFIAVCQGCPLL